METGLLLPRPGHLNTFFRAAAKYGVPVALIDAASRAAADVEDVISKHAGDRATFDSMVSSLVDGGARTRLTFATGRLAFRGQRHICGVYAKTQLCCRVIQPSGDGSLVDVVKVEGYLKLRQIRHGAPLVVSHDLTVDDDGTVLQTEREPLDPDGVGEHGVALLRQFCSRPLPTFETAAVEGGFVRGQLRSNGLGDVAAITCLVGNVTRAVPRYRSEHNTHGHCFAANAAAKRSADSRRLRTRGNFCTAHTDCRHRRRADGHCSARPGQPNPGWPRLPAAGCSTSDKDCPWHARRTFRATSSCWSMSSNGSVGQPQLRTLPLPDRIPDSALNHRYFLRIGRSPGDLSPADPNPTDTDFPPMFGY